MASENIVTIDENNWQQEVIQSDTPVLVDFWAEWCGPCRAIAPILEQLAAEKAGALKVAKVNVDQHQSLAAQFGIRSIPTLLLFSGGQVKEQIIGLQGKAQLEATLEGYL